MTADDARRLALALPEAVEHDHHGRPSFRVAGKIVATIWDERTMNVMVDEPGIRTAVAEHPDWCSQRYRGKRLAAVAVDLPRAPERELLTDAWEGKAGRPTTGAGQANHASSGRPCLIDHVPLATPPRPRRSSGKPPTSSASLPPDPNRWLLRYAGRNRHRRNAKTGALSAQNKTFVGASQMHVLGRKEGPDV